MKHFFSLLALIAVFATTRADDYYQIHTEKLNVRKGPNANEDVLATLKLGDSVNVDSIAGTWAKVRLSNGEEGYVNAKYLSKHFKDYKNSKVGRNNKYNFWEIIIAIVIVIASLYKYFKGPSNQNTSERSSGYKSKDERFLLDIKNGNVYLIKEGTTGSRVVYRNSNIIHCDLEDPSTAKSRFLAVTDTGDILICDTNSTGYKKIYNPNRDGAAYQARFRDDKTFIFKTGKGNFKGYFDSTRTDKLG